jgi:hypothetical protein
MTHSPSKPSIDTDTGVETPEYKRSKRNGDIFIYSLLLIVLIGVSIIMGCLIAKT